MSIPKTVEANQKAEPRWERRKDARPSELLAAARYVLSIRVGVCDPVDVVDRESHLVQGEGVNTLGGSAIRRGVVWRRRRGGWRYECPLSLLRVDVWNGIRSRVTQDEAKTRRRPPRCSRRPDYLGDS